MAAMVMRLAGLLLVACLGPMGCTHRASETVVVVPEQREARVDRPLTPEEVAVAVPVSAVNLYTIYSQDLFIGATPNQRFQNRPMLILGDFNGVNRRTPGRSYLELRTQDKDAFAYAELEPSAESLLEMLMPGQHLRLLCRCTGVVAGSPMLTDCRPPETHGGTGNE